MTDNNTESAPVPGDAGVPTQQPSGKQEATTSSVDVKALADALRPVIAEEVDRRTQSVKDKRIAKLQGDVNELLGRYDELLKEGLTPARARREIELDALLAERRGQPSGEVPPAQPTGTRTQMAGVDTEALLKELELDGNDAQVLAAMRSDKDFVGKLGLLVTLAADRQVQKQQPRTSNPATVIPAGGGASVVAEDLATVEAKLMEAQKNPSKNMALIRELTPIHEALLKQQKQ